MSVKRIGARESESKGRNRKSARGFKLSPPPSPDDFSSRSFRNPFLFVHRKHCLTCCSSLSLSLSLSQFYPEISVDRTLQSKVQANSTKMANAASGMAVHDDCKLRFLELKAKRTYRFIVYKIEEKQKQVIVEKVGEPAQSYEDFTACLPADECRYAVYDFDFMTEENVPKSRIFFIAWSPDTSRVRNKMIYASSKDRFKRELDGIQVELQATDPTEMGLDVIKSRAS